MRSSVSGFGVAYPVLTALTLIAAPVMAQEHRACQPPVALRATLAELAPDLSDCRSSEPCREAARARLGELLDRHGFELHMARQMALLEIEDGVRESEAVAKALMQQAEELGDNADAWYLAASKASADAKAELLDRALKLDANHPWAHLERARSLQREDPEEAVESLERFLEHCPSRLRDLGSRRLTLWPKELWQRHLPALEQATASLPPAERLAALPKLWQVQFHARPLTDHAALRQQITRQLAEVRQSEQRSHPLWWAALEEGYGLTGDAGALETVKQERADALPCRAESIGYRLEKVMRTYVPDANDMQIKSKQLDFAAEQLPKAAADLDALDAACPADADISAWRFQLLEKQESAPPERVVSVVEAFLAAGASKSGPVRLSSPDYRVAKLLVERGVALERVPALIERAREQRPDLGKFGMPPSLRSQVEASLQRVEVDMARLAGRAQLALGKAEAARREGERASSLYRALDAEAHKGRLANLHENLSAFLADAGLAELPELVVEAEAEAAQVETSSWKDVEETLAEFSLTDLQGRTWTLADFEGRGVLINFWATWCVPCVAELPEIQALHEELAGVDGLTVVTFNTDRNIGKVQPFLDQRNFTFPILMAADFLPEGSRSLPQNWLVDRQQVVRKKSTGFSVDGPGEWRHSALEALRKVVGE